MFRRAKLHLADVDPATLARAAAGEGPWSPAWASRTAAGCPSAPASGRRW